MHAHFLTPDYVAAAREAGHVRRRVRPPDLTAALGGRRARPAASDDGVPLRQRPHGQRSDDERRPRAVPRICFVVTHAGGVLPLLADRIDLFRQAFSVGSSGLPRTAEQLRRLWYDLAGSPLPDQLRALEAIAGTGHRMYGSDYCFTPAGAVARQIAALDAGRPSWQALTTANASTLFDLSRSAPSE